MSQAQTASFRAQMACFSLDARALQEPETPEAARQPPRQPPQGGRFPPRARARGRPPPCLSREPSSPARRGGRRTPTLPRPPPPPAE
eukprot:15451535-Alexandrium_andersonii.AAC.1